MKTVKVKRRKKICNKCGQKLWLKEFYRNAKGWISSTCKECTRKEKREEYNRNRKVEDGIFYHKSIGKIVEHKGKYTRIFWSPSMISYLERYFPTTKNEELAEEIGVSQRTMIRKARELGLEKDSQWMASIRNEHRLMAQAESKRKGYPGIFKKGNNIGKEYWFKRKQASTD